MLYFLKSLFLILLALISYQDFKGRKVSLFLFLLAGLFGVLIHYSTQYLYAFSLSLLMNMAVLLIVILILVLYSKLRLKMNLKEAIGLGDILFFIILSISFPTITFLVLFSSSLIFSLVLFLILKPNMINKTVPLAGLQALFIGSIIFMNMMFNFVNLYAV